MNSGNDKRTIQIHIRVTSQEYEFIKKKTEKSGLSMSTFVRKTLLDKIIVSAPPVDLPFLIREMKRAGSNINQLLRKLSVFGIAHPLELERCANQILETLQLITKTYRPDVGGE